jgi:hypothetical protein
VLEQNVAFLKILIGCSKINSHNEKKERKIYLDTSTFIIIISYRTNKHADSGGKYLEMKHIYPFKWKLGNINLSVTENVFGPEKAVEIYLKLCLIDENCEGKNSKERN